MHEEFSLTGNECALYHYLLKRSNSSNWRNPIEVMNSVAIEYLNLKSFRDVQASRDKLAAANLIQFKSLNGSKFVTYSLFDVELQTYAPIAKVLSKVTAKVSAEVVPKVTAEVIENTNVLYKPKPKQKPTPEADADEHFRNQFLNLKAKILEDEMFRGDAGKLYLKEEMYRSAVEEFFSKKINTREYISHNLMEESNCRRNLMYWLGKNYSRIEKEFNGNNAKNGQNNSLGRIGRQTVTDYLNRRND